MAGVRTYLPETPDAALALAIGFGSTVVLDLDGTLVPPGHHLSPPPAELDATLETFRRHAVAVVIVTNRRHLPTGLVAAPVVERANKPWTPSARLGDADPSCVLGDQFATDGLLARRLGVPLIRMPGLTSGRPWRTRILDRLLERFFRA